MAAIFLIFYFIFFVYGMTTFAKSIGGKVILAFTGIIITIYWVVSTWIERRKREKE
jgi:hypothetical protein